MYNYIEKKFVKNVLIVVSGTVMAQVISLIFSPVITRIYGPEAFGILGVFQSMVNILTPIAALTYPVAIVLPRDDSDAKGLVRLSLLVTLIISAIISVFLFCFGQEIAKIFRVEEIGYYINAIPLVMLFSVCYQVLNQWVIRKKLFKLKARITVLQSILINSAKSGFGLLRPLSSTIIIITAVGDAINAAMLALSVVSSSKNKYFDKEDKRYTFRSLFKLMIHYRDFPIFRAPEVFLNAVSQSLPILFLSIFFGPVPAGFYTIGRSVLGIPTQLIGNAVGDVYYPRCSEAVHKKESISKLLIRATIVLTVIGILPFGVIMAFGPSLFRIFFGEEWGSAGEYARWMALWLLIGFINIPSVKTLTVISAQNFLLYFSISATISRIVALIVGGYIFNNDIIAIILFSVVGAFLNFILIIGTVARSRMFDKRMVI